MYVGRDSMAVTQNETLFQILFTRSKDIPPEEIVFWSIIKYDHWNDCALCLCCLTCANSDIEMAPILMSVAIQVG